MDAHLPEWLWPIALLTSLGVFIDFLLGRAGQARTRRLLEEWWIRFDDVRWGNFGKEEASFAVGVLDKFCGRRLFGFRRWLFASVFVTSAASVGYFVAIVTTNGLATPKFISLDIGVIVFSAIGLAVSISLTRALSIFVSKHLPSGFWLNLIVSAIGVTVTYLLLVYWSSTTYIVRLVGTFCVIMIAKGNYTAAWDILSKVPGWFDGLVVQAPITPAGIIRTMKDNTILGDIDFYPRAFAVTASGYAANLLRLSISLLFFGSFIFQPLIKRPLSLLWLRIVESDKPIFTLVFGGMASIATAVSQIAKHLS